MLSQILEVACLADIGKYAEEFLSYLRSTIILEPTDTVQCVQQVCPVFGHFHFITVLVELLISMSTSLLDRFVN